MSAAAFVGSAALKVGPSKLNDSRLFMTESRSTVLPLKKWVPVSMLKRLVTSVKSFTLVLF